MVLQDGLKCYDIMALILWILILPAEKKWVFCKVQATDELPYIDDRALPSLLCSSIKNSIPDSSSCPTHATA